MSDQSDPMPSWTDLKTPVPSETAQGASSEEPATVFHALQVELAHGFEEFAAVQQEIGHAIGDAVHDMEESHEVVDARVDSVEGHYVQAHDEAPTTIDAGDYHLSPAEHDVPTET
jgi:hypothetical protein